jgi:hypothetical protein
MIERLMNLDRRIIFLFVLVGVTVPLLMEFSFPIKAGDNVRAVYEQIERVAAKKDGKVLLSFDYGGGSEPELQPMAHAVLRHLFEREIEVVAVCLWPDAVGLAQAALKKVGEESGRKYGVDYALMGFKPGNYAVILSMGQDFQNTYPTDNFGALTDTLAITRDVHSLTDFDFVFDLAAGESIDHWWIPYGQERYKFPFAGGCTAVMAPDLFPFIQSGQMVGMIGGLAGAAEYESLVGHPDKATAGMRPQSVTHVIIIAFILLANIAFFLSRRSSAV